MFNPLDWLKKEPKITTHKENSKTNLVKKHLESGKSITALEAFNLYNSISLPSIICRLRKEGLNIQDVYLQTKEGVKYKRYMIMKHMM